MKKRFVKSLTGVVAVSVAAVSLAACGGSSSTSGTQSSAENSGPITGQTLR